MTIDPPPAERIMDVARAAQALAPRVALSFYDVNAYLYYN
jgi:hypothetical protein